MKFRVYDKVEDELHSRPATRFYLCGDGERLLEGSASGNYMEVTEEYEVTFATPWKDAEGNVVWQGDVVRRVRDTTAEYSREEGLDEELIHDHSGGTGLVVHTGTEFKIKRLEGHKWSFYGPEGARSFDENEIRIIGNKWKHDLSQYDFAVK